MNLNQITIPSSNVMQSITFYKTLGLIPIVITDHYARFEFPDGEATFSVSLREEPFNTTIKVYFEVPHLKEEVKRLEEKGISFVTQPTKQFWLWKEALLKDPDGNTIVLYTAGSNRKFPPWRV